MRPALILLLLAAIAAVAPAEPLVRWLDKTGGVNQARVAAVIKDDIVAIHVRLRDGKVLELPTRHLLLLVREDDRVPDQRALVVARLALQNGDLPKDAAPLLDRLAAKGKPAWVREYASAARVLLAVRAGEKDAAKRIKAFASAHPDSRFGADVLIAEAILESRTKKDPAQAMHPFGKAHKALSKRGSLLVRARALIEGAERALQMQDDIIFRDFVQAMMTTVDAAAIDAPASIINDCTFLWSRLARQRYMRKHIIAHGEKPYGPLAKMKQLESETGFLLAELRSDMWYELGLDYRACGKEKEAKAAFAKSVKLATDPFRQARAASK